MPGNKSNFGRDKRSRITSVDSTSTKMQSNVQNQSIVDKTASLSPFVHRGSQHLTSGEQSMVIKAPKSFAKATSLGVFMSKSRSIAAQGKHSSQSQMKQDRDAATKKDKIKQLGATDEVKTDQDTEADLKKDIKVDKKHVMYTSQK